MAAKIFLGFGFGPIQAGLFASEAFAGGGFLRLIVAEIDQRLVDAVRANVGCYSVNIAGADDVPSPSSIAEHPVNRPRSVVTANIRVARGIGSGASSKPDCTLVLAIR